MKKIKNLFRLLAVLSSGRWGIALISAIFPSIIMMGFGLFLAIKYGYLLEMSIAIAVSTLLFTIPLYISSRSSRSSTNSDAAKNTTDEAQTESASHNIDDALVKASNEWSQAELSIWYDSKHYVRQQLVDDLSLIHI